MIRRLGRKVVTYIEDVFVGRCTEVPRPMQMVVEVGQAGAPLAQA